MHTLVAPPSGGIAAGATRTLLLQPAAALPYLLTEGHDRTHPTLARAQSRAQSWARLWTQLWTSGASARRRAIGRIAQEPPQQGAHAR